MILRRFMKHATDQNWYAVTLDILVVIVGIFLGMQVTDWNRNQEINNEVGIYKQRLVLELNENISRIDNDIKYYKKVNYYAGLVFRDIDKPVDELDEEFIINIYQATQRTGQRVANFTINEINSTGMLKYFKDIDLRQLIQIYDNTLKTNDTIFIPLTRYRIKIRGILNTEIQNMLYNNCDIILIKDNIKSTHTEINTDCGLGFTKDIYKEQIKQIKQYTSIKEDLSYRVSEINWKLTYLNVYKQQAESLLLHLKNTK
jgi:hypothetical protein